jgi:hypothetical protein
MADHMACARSHRPQRLPFLSLSTLVLLASACDGGQSATARDELPSFGTIEPEPFVTLGAATTYDDEQFFQITGVYRLTDGNTVVADASQQLRWFDAAGRLVRRVGGEGRGVNEYQALMWMRGYRGDSLITYDAARGQLRVLDANGVLARTFHFDTDRPPELALPDSPFPDGSLLVMAGPSHVQQHRDGWWAVLGLGTFTSEGGPGQDLGTALRHPCGRAVERCAAEFKPYQGTWTAGQRGVYIARPDRAEIRLVADDSVAILKGPESWTATSESGLPTYSRLLIDAEGHLWAQSGRHSRAAVFDQQGQLEGVIEVPPGLQVHQVGPDYVVGVVEDGAGNERVQLHRLHAF